MRVAEIEKKDDVKRPYIRQLLEPGLKFPLPHRRECQVEVRTWDGMLTSTSLFYFPGTTSKGWFAANRPATWA